VAADMKQSALIIIKQTGGKLNFNMLNELPALVRTDKKAQAVMIPTGITKVTVWIPGKNTILRGSVVVLNPYRQILEKGHVVHYPTIRKVAGSRPDKANYFFLIRLILPA
jgi:hypothetical protein